MLTDARTSALLASAPLSIMLADASTSALLASVLQSSMHTDADTSTVLALGPLAPMLTDARTSALLALAPTSSMLTDAPAEERSVQGCGRKQRIGRDTYEPLCTMQSDFRLLQQHFGSRPPARG